VGVPIAAEGPTTTLLSLYDGAVVEVHGYLFARCRNRETAEELTAEVFMAAVDSIRRSTVAEVTTAWLIGIARHKLVDHWRRAEREQRRLHAVADDPTVDKAEVDPWDVQLDVLAARDALEQLDAKHRAVLTLRYLDGLGVPEVASVLERSVHATETLLVRARRAFRETYESGEGRGA
jgi:RNA polymerase sigma-70 factor (ECF subfamily)